MNSRSAAFVWHQPETLWEQKKKNSDFSEHEKQNKVDPKHIECNCPEFYSFNCNPAGDMCNMLDGAVHTALDCTVIAPEQPAEHKKTRL